jgi:hypothetical protein
MLILTFLNCSETNSLRLHINKSKRYANNPQYPMLMELYVLVVLDKHEALMENQRQLAASIVPVLEVAPKEPAP